MSYLMDEIKKHAKQLGKHIVLPEGNDERIVRAGVEIAKQKIARVTLIGDIANIKKLTPDLDLKGVTIINPNSCDKLQQYADLLYELRKSKGLTKEQAESLAKEPLYFGVLMVKCHHADGMVGGAVHSTGDLLRPALQVIKTAPGISTVSSCFIMCLKEGKAAKYGENGILLFGDCAVNIDPTAEQLASIAISTAQSAESICKLHPKVAMLSFSSLGSAKHENVDRVVQATKIAKELNPQLNIDGELQADAALVESVASLKAPKSSVAGHANVLIFPDLQSGNIGYKLVQRLANAEAIGPICQGMAMPVNDLSRGCSIEDIISMAAVTVLQCKS